MENNKEFLPLQKIAEGGFGEIWKAIYSGTNEVVAVKLTKGDLSF